ncbi:MAG TPA: hypothetical protein VNS32_01875, partial [Flavisolibacter sp.]|nr:hypothetical protein [Flavisolibacter sp.]
KISQSFAYWSVCSAFKITNSGKIHHTIFTGAHLLGATSFGGGSNEAEFFFQFLSIIDYVYFVYFGGACSVNKFINFQFNYLHIV